MNRKATLIDLVVIVVLVAIAFLVCMGDKTLVGFLIVVPLFFIPIGLVCILTADRSQQSTLRESSDGIESRDV